MRKHLEAGNGANTRFKGQKWGKPRGEAPGLVLRPGFEPGSAAREAAILDRTILPEPHFILAVTKLYFLLNFKICVFFTKC
jgi:hypothetical protein